MQEQIPEILQASYYPLSTLQLSRQLGVSWHTIQQCCMELQLRRKINRMHLSHSHLWISTDFGKKLQQTGNQGYDSSQYTPPIIPDSQEKLQTAEEKIVSDMENEWIQLLNKEIEKEIEKELGQELEKTQDRNELFDPILHALVHNSRERKPAQENRITAQNNGGGEKK